MRSKWSAPAQPGGHLILRANLSPQPEQGSEYTAGYQLALGPERTIRNVATVQQMTAIEGGGSQGFYSMRLRSSEAVNLGPNASMELGNDVQSVQGASEATSSLPFVNATWHSDSVSASYRLATSPAMQNAGELADSTTLAPMFSEEGGRVRIERGFHQELRFEDNTATRRAMVAFYEDSGTESDHRWGRLGFAAGSYLGQHAVRSGLPGVPRYRARVYHRWIQGCGRAKDSGVSLGNGGLR